MVQQGRVQNGYLQRLQNMVGARLKIRINNNRSTMLHVRWKHDETLVSLHHMFVKAPHSIQQAIASYIRREDDVIAPHVMDYIDQNASLLDHSQMLQGLETVGSTYNLQLLYQKLNKTYFANSLNLAITWFGEDGIKVRSRRTLGIYYSMVDLIKIHRLLDNPRVPLYVIEYVIYHEMVHAVSPAVKDERGRTCVHTKEFKELERNFLYFEEAQNWLNKNNNKFFVSQKESRNGRTQQMGKHQAQKGQGRRCQGKNIYSYL